MNAQIRRLHISGLPPMAALLALTILLAACSSARSTVVPVSSPPDSWVNQPPIMPDNPGQAPRPSGESYAQFPDNPFRDVAANPLATLAVDVDTGAYSNVRRFITQNQLPPRDAVRIEELLNYFNYDYPRANGPHPIATSIEAASAPWNPEHRLARVGIRAKDVEMGHSPANLVFLVDVSGSMNSVERLPLLQRGMRMLVDRLSETDTVSIVTYAGAAGVALTPTNGANKETILRAIDDMRAGGSTNGASGIHTAYDLAVSHFIRGGVNRVILMTDGDFNVGVTRLDDLVELIEHRAQSGVFLSVLGVGQGNLKDATMERLADKGNGHYAYIDTLNEARKVLVEQMSGTLITVAKDVKIQVEFNPARVKSYRVIGYENRLLAANDFNNDRKDGGEMGAGHTVTALFELVPLGALQPDQNTPHKNELLNVRIRYKAPEGSESTLVDFPFVDAGQSFSQASKDFRFAAAVAAFGMILRDSPFRGTATLESVAAVASDSRGSDRSGYREEFVTLVEKARQIRRIAALR